MSKKPAVLCPGPDPERAYQDFTSDGYVTAKAEYLGHTDFEVLENYRGVRRAR